MRFGKFLHIVGLSLFVGSIGGHILFSSLADSMMDLAQIAVLRTGLDLSVRYLTLPGIGLLWLSGLYMVLKHSRMLRANWLRVKIAVSVLVTINGIFILTPIVGKLARLAKQAVGDGGFSAEYWTFRVYEDIAGTINLAMVLLVVVMACYKPTLKFFKRRILKSDSPAAQ
ncbi:DUF2269 domain-containing protein [Aestuariispira ectoiniformans]|uniref:DUF2269 domain-containing protein n=1 Tax=Aestuariispira ectoiniformans TaxID=2775080 RepID=UPI00223B6941|nr:DUF2269 domain-containing protein [Aestuariispira ectoiniformans]